MTVFLKALVKDSFATHLQNIMFKYLIFLNTNVLNEKKNMQSLVVFQL